MASTPSTSPQIKNIRDLKLTGRTVFMRLDFNVPLSAADSEGERHIEDDSRIQESIPTIQYAIEKGAKLVLASHLGRPDGKVKPRVQYGTRGSSFGSTSQSRSHSSQ